jgi:hypothetical protein
MLDILIIQYTWSEPLRWPQKDVNAYCHSHEVARLQRWLAYRNNVVGSKEQ